MVLNFTTLCKTSSPQIFRQFLYSIITCLLLSSDCMLCDVAKDHCLNICYFLQDVPRISAACPQDNTWHFILCSWKWCHPSHFPWPRWKKKIWLQAGKSHFIWYLYPTCPNLSRITLSSQHAFYGLLSQSVFSLIVKEKAHAHLLWLLINTHFLQD